MDAATYVMGMTEQEKSLLTREELCALQIHRMSNEQIYFPIDGFRNGFLDVSKAYKAKGNKGLSGVLKQYSVFGPAYVLFVNANDSPLTEWDKDIFSTRVPMSNGAILKHRPLITEWRANMNIMFSPEVTDGKQIVEMINEAGVAVGIGSYRFKTAKGKEGKFGGYEVIWRSDHKIPYEEILGK